MVRGWAGEEEGEGEEQGEMGRGQAGERGFDLLWCSPSGAAVCSLKGPALHNIDDGVNGPPTLQSDAVGLPV